MTIRRRHLWIRSASRVAKWAHVVFRADDRRPRREIAPPGATDRNGRPARADRLSDFGDEQWSRFEQSRNLADLDQAVQAWMDAFAAIRHNRLKEAMYASNVSNALRVRFELMGNRDDLDKAIASGHQAITACPRGHPASAICLTNLSVALQTRFAWSGNPADL